MLATWNGKAFTAAAGGSREPRLRDASPTSVVLLAVALRRDRASTSAPARHPRRRVRFAEVWNGKSWTATKWAGPKGSTIAGPVRCVLHLGDQLRRGRRVRARRRSLTPPPLSFNGTKWSVVTVPSAGSGLFSDFEGVSCPKPGRLRGHRQVRQGVGDQRQAAGRLLERQGLEAQGRLAPVLPTALNSSRKAPRAQDSHDRVRRRHGRARQRRPGGHRLGGHHGDGGRPSSRRRSRLRPARCGRPRFT